MKHAVSAAAALLATFSLVAAQAPTKCSPDSPCPADAPCCSQYGQCGVGAYCLGGCDPKSSFDLKSCMAAPVCKSADHKFNSMDDVAPNTVYLGDASDKNWVSSGKPATYNGDSILLTMAPSTVGTLLSSAQYVWYGKISATMRTSQGKGVVTAFILMSDMKDEIDFEFVGDETTSAQSNYYFQGITDYHNMIPLDVSDTRTNMHTYTIDWTPEELTWLIDGNAMRTLKKSDTWNSTTGTYHYPQTPARVQLSLWPAGLESNGEGTIEWSGGLVDWNSQYMQNGYYFAQVTDVTIECYDPPAGHQDFGDKSYYYTSAVGTNDTVAIGNNNTVLSSFYASGDNPTYDPNAKHTDSGTSSAAPKATQLTVPGISGGGNAASSGENPASDQGSGSGNSNSNAGNGNSGSAGSSGSSGSTNGVGHSGFSQGTDNTSSDAPKIFAGSFVALLGFFAVALML